MSVQQLRWRKIPLRIPTLGEVGDNKILCLSVSESFTATGTTLGYVAFFHTEEVCDGDFKLARAIHVANVAVPNPITFVEFCDSGSMLACCDVSLVYVLSVSNLGGGTVPVIRKMPSTSPITCLRWNTFEGAEGLMFGNNDGDLFLCFPPIDSSVVSVVCKEDAAIVEICPGSPVVAATLQRCVLLHNLSSEGSTSVIPVGSKPVGSYGGCSAQGNFFCSRPGNRVWCVDAETGQVKSTQKYSLPFEDVGIGSILPVHCGEHDVSNVGPFLISPGTNGQSVIVMDTRNVLAMSVDTSVMSTPPNRVLTHNCSVFVITDCGNIYSAPLGEVMGVTMKSRSPVEKSPLSPRRNSDAPSPSNSFQSSDVEVANRTKRKTVIVKRKTIVIRKADPNDNEVTSPSVKPVLSSSPPDLPSLMEPSPPTTVSHLIPTGDAENPNPVESPAIQPLQDPIADIPPEPISLTTNEGENVVDKAEVAENPMERERAQEEEESLRKEEERKATLINDFCVLTHRLYVLYKDVCLHEYHGEECSETKSSILDELSKSWVPSLTKLEREMPFLHKMRNGDSPVPVTILSVVTLSLYWLETADVAPDAEYVFNSLAQAALLDRCDLITHESRLNNHAKFDRLPQVFDCLLHAPRLPIPPQHFLDFHPETLRKEIDLMIIDGDMDVFSLMASETNLALVHYYLPYLFCLSSVKARTFCIEKFPVITVDNVRVATQPDVQVYCSSCLSYCGSPMSDFLLHDVLEISTVYGDTYLDYLLMLYVENENLCGDQRFTVAYLQALADRLVSCRSDPMRQKQLTDRIREVLTESNWNYTIEDAASIMKEAKCMEGLHILGRGKDVMENLFLENNMTDLYALLKLTSESKNTRHIRDDWTAALQYAQRVDTAMESKDPNTPSAVDRIATMGVVLLGAKEIVLIMNELFGEGVASDLELRKTISKFKALQ
eukprot:PhF_6_TR36004/c0_g1_i1/m.52169